MNLDYHLPLSTFRRVQYTLVTGLVLLGLARYLYPHIPNHPLIFSPLVIFDVGVENSVPTWFSVLNLLLGGLLFFLLAEAARHRSEPTTWGWYLMAGVLTFLSMDEGASIHEQFTKLSDKLVEHGWSPAWAQWGWIPFALVLVAFVAVALIPFLRALPRDLVGRFVLAGTLYLIGAVALEYAGEQLLVHGISTENGILYQLEEVLEEALEMYAIAYLNVVLYARLAQQGIRLQVRFGHPRSPADDASEK